MSAYNYQAMQKERRALAAAVEKYNRPKTPARITPPASQAWRPMRDSIKTEVDHYRANENAMTPYERKEHTAALIQKREAIRTVIEGGVLSEHSAAVANLEAAARKVEAERARITNSWDSKQLAADLQVYTARITAAAHAGDLTELTTIRDEARSSQDKYKMRASAIAIQSNAVKLPYGTQDEHGIDGAMYINRLQREAAADLADLRSSPGLDQAEAELDAALQAMQAANNEIRITAIVYGELDPRGGQMIHNERYNAALARINISPDGSFTIGE